MKYSQAQRGRTFILRLEDGEVLHESIEKFARDQGIQAAALIVLGGADKDSVLISGPKEGRPGPESTSAGGAGIEPMEIVLDETYEVTGTGTIFPDGTGRPVLHMHIAAGRRGDTAAGCVRSGVRVWHIMEVILFELTGTDASRKFDRATGFELLEP